MFQAELTLMISIMKEHATIAAQHTRMYLMLCVRASCVRMLVRAHVCLRACLRVVGESVYVRRGVQINNLFISSFHFRNSKLANILFVNELQNRVKGVDVFSLSPGLGIISLHPSSQPTIISLFLFFIMYHD